MRRGLPPFLGVVFVAVGFAALAVACGGEEKEATPVGQQTPAPRGATLSQPSVVVEVTLSEWAVEPDATSAPAGEVTFVVHNNGSLDHELVVIKPDLDPADLPVEGSEVAEERAGVPIGRTPVFSPGETETVTLDLEPGSYVLICNVPGHYQAGMFASFLVE